MTPTPRIAASLVAGALAAALAAPAAAASGPAGPTPTPAVAAWHRIALDAVERAKPGQHHVVRLFSYLSLAQHAAVTEAPRDADAVASASKRVIAALLPAQAAQVDALHRERHASDSAAGTAIADRVLAQAQSDGFARPWTGTVPDAPTAWRSLATPPAAPALPGVGTMRTFFIGSGSALRAEPPPAPDSARFVSDLAEVRRFVTEPTPERTRIAKFYEMTTGTMAGGFWNERAMALITSDGLGERDATRVLVAMNLAMMDSLVACHDSKYAYWVPRPSQVEPAIKAIIGVPNHPSYPSNHACLSTAAGHVLAHFFPARSAEMKSIAAEAGVSRIYAGIHYRFDVEAGERIGRTAAAEAVSRRAETLDRFTQTLLSRR